jgi:hypothetical protein
MRKITANDSHRRDDICDTLYDSVKLGLIDNVIMTFIPDRVNMDAEKAKAVMGTFQKILALRNKRYSQ